MNAADRLYLDHNATTPLWPQARAAMLEALDCLGNPSSPHADGRRARALVDNAREQVAALLQVPPLAVVFTGGGAEANGLALAQAEALGAERLLVGAGEHACILAHAAAHPLPRRTVALDADGRLDLGDLETALRESPSPAFLACAAANNETGVVQPVAEAAAMTRAAGGFTHCDAVQAAGRVRFRPADMQLDFCALSAHKMGGPTGVGALVCLGETRPAPLPFRAVVRGGGQERGWRSGTENVAGIAGFGAAAAAAPQAFARFGALARLRDNLESGLISSPSVVIFGKDAGRMANVSCFAAPGARAETWLMALDLRGIAVGSGSACSSGRISPSHVLAAMGVAPALARNALRVSLGWQTREADIRRFLDGWNSLARRLNGKPK